MEKNKISVYLRLLILFLILALVTYGSYMHQIFGGAKAASIHALCPFGALESLYALIFLGTFIQKIFLGTFVLFGITVILAIVFRRSFCGLLCPFGALQELFAKIGQKILKKRMEVPKAIDVPLRYLKYLILPLTFFMAWYYSTLWMSTFDPYSAYAHITDVGGAIAEDPLAIIGFILLGVTLIGSFIYDRFFCKYLCPAGAFYAIIGKISPTNIERNNHLCIHCGACTKSCPMNIDVAKGFKIKSAECINCNECVNVCPKKGALDVKVAGKIISPLVILLLVVGLFFGTIFLAQLTGNFQLKTSELKVGEILSISDLKGSLTIEESAQQTGFSLDEIYQKLGIPISVPKETMLKDVYTLVPGYNFHDAKEKASSN